MSDTEDEVLRECDNCGFETIDLKSRRHFKDSTSWVSLCDLCSNTRAGNLASGEQYSFDNHDVLTAICYVGNAIISAIKETK